MPFTSNFLTEPSAVTTFYMHLAYLHPTQRPASMSLHKGSIHTTVLVQRIPVYIIPITPI